jgi:hypothetical protein
LIAQCFAPKREVRWIVPDRIELLQATIKEAMPDASFAPDGTF